MPSPASPGIPTPATMSTGHPLSNLERLYLASPVVSMSEPYNRKDYPRCKFWTEDAWREWVKEEKEKGSFKPGNRKQGEGVNSSFMEDEYGNRVELRLQKQILKEASRTWISMKGFGVEVTVHRYMPSPALDYFRSRMESKFEILRFCADHWKSDQVWRENYSASHVGRATADQNDSSVVPEPGSSVDDAGSSAMGASEPPEEVCKSSKKVGVS